MILAGLLVCAGLLVAPAVAQATPESCPTTCDRIPNTAWIASSAIPLNSVYHWPGLAGIAVTAVAPRFRFEELCASPPLPADARGFAVGAKATVAGLDGQWQVQAQVMHWRGDTWVGGQLAQSVFSAAVATLRACQATAPLSSPSVTTDEPDRMAAVFSGPVVLHQYLVAHPESSTITELALWSPAPLHVPWPATLDAAVLDAMTAPLCAAYLGSCG